MYNRESDRLILRPWCASDAEDMFLYASDPAIGPAAGWNPHASLEESRSIVKMLMEQPAAYAIELKELPGHAIGAIELKQGARNTFSNRTDEAEIGFWLGKPFWGRGIMPEALNLLVGDAFENRGMRALWCAYYLGNEKSKRVQEKCGFVYHHTEEKLEVPQLKEVRMGIVNLLTKEAWEKK